MAHHLPDLDDGPDLPLPRTVRGRVLLAAAGAPVIALLLVALWLTGGLDDAKAVQFKTAEPGKAVQNKLLKATLHEASVGADPDLGGYRLEVRAELESLADEPVPASQLNTLFKVDFGRKDLKAETMRVRLVRLPDTELGDLQPKMPEEVVLVWTLAEGDPADDKIKTAEETFGEDFLAEPDDVSAQLAEVDKAEITVTGAKFEPGFTDPAKRWWTDDKTAGVYTLPLEKG
ncbi:hypothetical protein [Nocardiopsis potens]|uniref:hypothetical protein n=1 Tax=Nocardiopsis potens TaxID=1246458 RepID=UPI00034CA69F|nr:hypothetical protein [Nocardiopsis potens]